VQAHGVGWSHHLNNILEGASEQQQQQQDQGVNGTIVRTKSSSAEPHSRDASQKLLLLTDSFEWCWPLYADALLWLRTKMTGREGGREGRREGRGGGLSEEACAPALSADHAHQMQASIRKAMLSAQRCASMRLLLLLLLLRRQLLLLLLYRAHSTQQPAS